jgi:hypothetical protein
MSVTPIGVEKVTSVENANGEFDAKKALGE